MKFAVVFSAYLPSLNQPRSAVIKNKNKQTTATRPTLFWDRYDFVLGFLVVFLWGLGCWLSEHSRWTRVSPPHTPCCCSRWPSGKNNWSLTRLYTETNLPPPFQPVRPCDDSHPVPDACLSFFPDVTLAGPWVHLTKDDGLDVASGLEPCLARGVSAPLLL